MSWLQRKFVVDGDVNFKDAGKGNQEYRFALQAESGPPCLLTLIINVGRNEDVTTYHAAILVDRQRVRGIDFSPIGRKNLRTKQSIPVGWHQNIIDPTAGTNLHAPLEIEPVTDLVDFAQKVANLWHIEFKTEALLL
jgi:hypothetical protein